MQMTFRSSAQPRLVRRLLTTCAMVLMLSTAGAHAEAPAITQYKLPNGLTVILAPLAGAKRVTVVTRYNVGSADEPKGRSGFAHLFEHLMFEGTHDIPDFDAAASKSGAEQNAFTEWDDTTYYISGPGEYLPQYLRLEADRMANLADAVTEADLKNQRDIIRNELRQRTLDQPGAAAYTQSEVDAVDKTHPYGHSTIGSMADLDAATLDDVRGFHRTYYVPGNASVTITGGIDIAEARDLIAKTYGLVPAQAEPPRVSGQIAAHETRREVFTDAVETPTVAMLWTGPASGTPEDMALGILSQALSSDAGPLFADLVDRQHLATAAGANWEGRRLGGTFTLMAKAAKGVSAEQLEAALKASFDTLIKDGIAADHLHAVGQSIAASFDQAQTDPTSYAFILEQAQAETGDAATWRNTADMAKTFTPDQAKAALQLLASAPAVISVVTPGERNNKLPPVLTEPTGTASPLPFAPRPNIAIPEIAPLSAAALDIPVPVQVTLDNGIPVTVYSGPDATTSAVSILLPAGSTATSGSQLGLIDLTLKLDMRGAGDMTRRAFSSALEKVGASLMRRLGNHSSGILLTAPSANLGEAVDLLAAAIRTPRFNEADWSFEVEQSSQRLAEMKSQPEDMAFASASAAAYPKGTAEGEEKTAEIVRGLKMADASALYARLFTPQSMKIVAVSQRPAAEIKAMLDKAFAGWDPQQPAVTAPAPVSPVFTAQEVTREVPGATQAAIVVEFAAPTGPSKDAAAFEIATQVLAGSANNRLNAALREDKGWSYGVSGGADAGEKGLGNGMGYFFTTVQADHTRDAVAAIRQITADLVKTPITDAEFTAARQEIRNSALGAFETSANLAQTVTGVALSGYMLSDIADKLKFYDEVTLADVQGQAAKLVALPMTMVIAGDPKLMK